MGMLTLPDGCCIARQSTVDEAIDNAPIQNVRRGCTIRRDDEMFELIHDAQYECEHVCDEYDVPVDPTDIAFTVFDDDTYYGMASALTDGLCLCRNSDLDITGQHNRVWEVTSQPRAYVIHLNRILADRRDATLPNTVRHELAHVCDYHETMKTTEKSANHQQWLDTFDAW